MVKFISINIKGSIMTENNLKEIKEFINQWKLRAINYYHQAIEDFKKNIKNLKKNILKQTMIIKKKKDNF